MAQTIKLKRSATQGSIPATSALSLGEVAINTYDGKMYIKKSVGGTESVVEVGGSGGGLSSSFTVYEYSATANQTTFSGSDGNSNTLAYDTGTPPKILVYLNGVLLDFTTDYTASNGTSVVLTNGAASNDLVQVAAYKSEASVALDIDLVDDVKLKFGDDDDLQIYHDGSHSRIKDTGTGNLILNTQAFRVNGADDAEGMIKANQDGTVELYYNGSKKFETTSTGATVTGNIAVTGTVDGRDLATDGSKLDNIESNADVTDATNVTAAGALMDSEVTNLAQVKAFDSSDYATAAQGSTADSAMQDLVDDTTPQLGGNLDLNSNNITGTGNISNTGTISSGAITSSGNISGAALIIDSATAVDKSSNYMVFYDGSGAPALYAGNTSDNRNYYQSNHHRFRSDDANTNFAEISSVGMIIGAEGPETNMGKLHVKDSDSGATPYQNGNGGITIERNGRAALNFLTPNTQDAYVFWGDPQTANIAYIGYVHSTDQAVWKTSGTFRLQGGQVDIDEQLRIKHSNTVLDISGDSSTNTYFASTGELRIRPNGTTVNKIVLNSSYINAPAYQVGGTEVIDSSRNISSGNITTTGYLRGPSTFTIDPAAHGDNTGTVVIAGNLQVDGTTTTINSTALTVDDKNITLASGSTNAAAANGAGLTVDCGSGTDATFTYDGTNDEWDLNKRTKITSSTTSALLELSGSATGVFQKIDNTNSSGLYSYLQLETSGRGEGNGYIIKNSGTGNGLSLGSLYLWNDGGTNDIIEFVPNGTIANRTSIMENGNLIIRGGVGIGTTAPASNLHIKTSVDNSVAQGLVIERSANSDKGYINYNGGGFQFRSTVGDPIVFGETDAEHMRILPDGNVGIGITNPTTKLHVAGIVQVVESSNTAFYGGDYVRVFGSGQQYGFRNTGGTTKANISMSGNSYFNGGNVGIGTSSPNAKLQVAYNGGHTSGNISISQSNLDLYNPLEANTDEKGAILTFSDHYQDSNGYPRTVRAAIKGGTDTVGNTADGFLAFYTDSGGSNSATERMRIDSTGNIGMGTTSVSSALSGSNRTFKIEDADGADIRFVHTGGADFTVGVTNSNTSYIWNVGAHDILFGTAATERMRLRSNGDWAVSNTVANVASAYSNQGGCGWVDSDLHFEVATTSNRSAAEFGRNNGNSGDVITIRQQSTSVGMIGTEGGDSLVIQSNGSTGTGIRFHPSRAAVEPVRAGVTIDNTISLGADTRRFKDLHLSNAANIGHASIETSSTSTSATTQVAIDTMAAATFRSAKYTIQVTNTTDSTYHLTEILLIHNGTTPQITEYGTIFTGSAEATFDADISSGNVRLLATPATTDSMTFKVVRHCITV